MTMIERVARALARAHFERKQHYGACTKEARVNWLTDSYWKNHVGDASDAIEAMREPTEAMIDAPEGNTGIACEVWQAMIEAAKAERGAEQT